MKDVKCLKKTKVNVHNLAGSSANASSRRASPPAPDEVSPHLLSAHNLPVVLQIRKNATDFIAKYDFPNVSTGRIICAIYQSGTHSTVK